MSVGGGTFTVQNKTLPGAYYQFRASVNTSKGASVESGTLLCVLQ